MTETIRLIVVFIVFVDFVFYLDAVVAVFDVWKLNNITQNDRNYKNKKIPVIQKFCMAAPTPRGPTNRPIDRPTDRPADRPRERSTDLSPSDPPLNRSGNGGFYRVVPSRTTRVPRRSRRMRNTSLLCCLEMGIVRRDAIAARRKKRGAKGGWEAKGRIE